MGRFGGSFGWVVLVCFAHYLLLIVLSFMLYVSGFGGTSLCSLFPSSGGSGSDGDGDDSRRICKIPAKFEVLATFSLRPAARIFLFRPSPPLKTPAYLYMA